MMLKLLQYFCDQAINSEREWIILKMDIWELQFRWLEKTLESSLGCKEIKPVNPKETQSWIFIGRANAEAEVLILWLLDAKTWLIGKDPDAWQDWRQEKRMLEHEMVGWHHRFNGHDFKQAPGFGDGQGSLACCSPWGHKKSDMTDWLNWADLQAWQVSCVFSRVSLPTPTSSFYFGLEVFPGINFMEI